MGGGAGREGVDGGRVVQVQVRVQVGPDGRLDGGRVSQVVHNAVGNLVDSHRQHIGISSYFILHLMEADLKTTKNSSFREQKNTCHFGKRKQCICSMGSLPAMGIMKQGMSTLISTVLKI